MNRFFNDTVVFVLHVFAELKSILCKKTHLFEFIHFNVVYVISCRLFGTGVERSTMAASQKGKFVSSLSFVKISVISMLGALETPRLTRRHLATVPKKSTRHLVYDCELVLEYFTEN